jgi:ATP-dependent helicase YprA (DUF1998 family)
MNSQASFSVNKTDEAMINSVELAEGLKDRLLSYMASALPIGNHESQRFLGERFFEAWQRDLFKGPFFETIPPYQRGESLAKRLSGSNLAANDQLFASRFQPKFSWADVDHKFSLARRLRDRVWVPGSNEADIEHSQTNQDALWGRQLFQHQWQAFDKVSHERRNVIVATGTGSGKTECFQLPVLTRC